MWNREWHLRRARPNSIVIARALSTPASRSRLIRAYVGFEQWICRLKAYDRVVPPGGDLSRCRKVPRRRLTQDSGFQYCGENARYYFIPSVSMIKERDVVDFMRIALISVWAAESFQSLAF
jgi:hypothetical protein